MDKKTKSLQASGLILIGLTLAGVYHVKYRIDDSKIVKIIAVDTKIEEESGFKNTQFKYVHRDGKLDSKSVLAKFEHPLSKIANKNGCIKMELTFSDWYPWDKYRGLVSFEEVACPF
jgi:hypothetical protein